MTTKRISRKEMNQLRQVLRGKDQLAIWEIMQQLGLSPNDAVGKKFIMNLNASGATVERRQGVCARGGGFSIV